MNLALALVAVVTAALIALAVTFSVSHLSF
jgi:hypothetical protein